MDFKVPFAVVLSIFLPTVSGVAAYFKAQADVQQEMQVMRLEREQLFVRKADMKELQAKLEQVAEDVAYIKFAVKRR